MALNPLMHTRKHARLIISALFAVWTAGYGTLSFAGSTISSISIQSDADFTPVGASTGCGCVTSTDADGTKVISSWQINSNGVPGVSIVAAATGAITTAFRLDHITVHTAGNADGILLQNITSPASITFPNIDTPPSSQPIRGNRGIEIVNSSGVLIYGGSVKSVGDWGLRVSKSPGTAINGVQISHVGLVNPNSVSSAGLPYNDLDPWLGGLVGDAPGGLLVIDSDHVTVSNVGADSDAYVGIELVRSSYCYIGMSATHYPDYYGLVLQSSNYNSVTNNTFGASDYNGVVLRNSSYNTITNNNIGATGPTGAEWPAGVVGYFTSSMYVGWGSQGNVVRGNAGKTSVPGIIIDDGHVPMPVPTASSQGTKQTLNPLNDQGTGGEPSSYAWLISFGNGASWASAITPSPAAGVETQANVCGNSFAGAPSYSPGIDPNQPCK